MRLELKQNLQRDETTGNESDAWQESRQIRGLGVRAGNAYPLLVMLLVIYSPMKSFETLSEREMLALAISLEEEDERVYADYAEGLRETFAASAAVFDGMRQEESGHRRRLIEQYRQQFGEHIPLIRRQDVKGFVQRKPVWLAIPLR